MFENRDFNHITNLNVKHDKIEISVRGNLFGSVFFSFKELKRIYDKRNYTIISL